MADWLEAEAEAAGRRVRMAHIQRLRDLGVPPEAWKWIGQHQLPFGFATIADLPDGLYQPDPEGKPAMIVPVTMPEVHEGLWGQPITMFPVVDIIAFQTSQPVAWRWRTGHAWALGEHLLADPIGGPVEIVATPLAWLAAGGDACCILDWSPSSPAWAALRTGPELVVTDRFLEAKLVKAMTRAAPRPTIRRGRHAA